MNPFPGNPQHQALLQTIVASYEHDPRIQAIIVFGSLGRGNWDAYSDIDLDIILDSMLILAGRLDRAAIEAAGQANTRPAGPPLPQLLDQVLRYAASASGYIQRGSYWLCVELFHRMRGLLMEIFQRTHGGQRPHQAFESQAGERLQARLKATLPGSDLLTIHQGLLLLLDLLETDLAELSAGQLSLSAAHCSIINRLRKNL